MGNYWQTLGMAHYQTEDWPKAVDTLEKSIQIDSRSDGIGQFFLAMAYWQQNNPSQARVWYDRAVRWMEQHNKLEDEEFQGVHAEAAALLGLSADPNE